MFPVVHSLAHSLTQLVIHGIHIFANFGRLVSVMLSSLCMMVLVSVLESSRSIYIYICLFVSGDSYFN